MSDEPRFIEHSGKYVKFIPDDAVEKGSILILQYADNLGKRFPYYDVRHHPHMNEMERVAMMRKVKDTI